MTSQTAAAQPLENVASPADVAAPTLAGAVSGAAVAILSAISDAMGRLVGPTPCDEAPVSQADGSDTATLDVIAGRPDPRITRLIPHRA